MNSENKNPPEIIINEEVYAGLFAIPACLETGICTGCGNCAYLPESSAGRTTGRNVEKSAAT